MEDCENWQVNILQKNYLFTKDLIYTLKGQDAGITWFVNKIEKIILQNKTIHLIFFSGLDIELELKRNQQKIFCELQNIYFKKE